jgi:hypothetical protein
MEQLITDRLRDNLARLNLNRVCEVLEDIAGQAETDKRSYLSFRCGGFRKTIRFLSMSHNGLIIHRCVSSFCQFRVTTELSFTPSCASR